MLRIRIVLLIALFSLVSCSPVETDANPLNSDIIETDDSIVIDDNPVLEKPVLTVMSDTIETDEASLSIEIDSLEITFANPTVTVSVELTALEDISTILGTGSFKEKGLIHIRIISIDDDSNKIYSELYNRDVLDNIYELYLQKGNKINRELQFSRRPLNEGLGIDPPCQIGLYKVQVALEIEPHGEFQWYDTEILINVMQ